MPKIIKNTLLNYLPKNLTKEKAVNHLRVFDFNHKPILKGEIIYLCERNIRVKDNPALNFALDKSKELRLPLKIIHPRVNYEVENKQNFIDKQINSAKNDFLSLGFDFEIVHNFDYKNYEIALLIIDFNPVCKKSYLKSASFKIFEIDSNNIIPARYVSDKQEYNAMGLRRKIYFNIAEFLSEFENIETIKTEAEFVLDDFIQNKLPYYAEFKNDPVKNVTSGLSKYLNLGFISSKQAAIEVIKANTERINKEAYLEELIIRRELADNFCLYCKNYKTLDCISNWAKKTLFEHKNDLRIKIYTRKELEEAKTNDEIWNAAQNQLKKEGIIHGYLRMYWVKKISEWMETPEKALENAIYLNDKYAHDAPSTDGYTGILWGIGGLHDRAFQDFFITGKIRRMTSKSIKRKFDIEKYIEKYTE